MPNVRPGAQAAVLVALGLLLTSCTAPAPFTPDEPQKASPTPRPSSSPTVVDGIVDPLSEITDPNSPRYEDQDFSRILEARGRGPTSWRRSITAGTKAVRAYVACAPAGPFTVALPKRFSGGCSSRFQSFADIPVSGTALTIHLGVPKQTRYSVLLISSSTD